jgi:ABC-type proline/glycine betaine transport system permease subunit
MTTTNIGIVYNSTTQQILRVIIPDTDAQLTTSNFCGPGESIYLMPVATYNGFTNYTAFIAAAVAAVAATFVVTPL